MNNSNLDAASSGSSGASICVGVRVYIAFLMYEPTVYSWPIYSAVVSVVLVYFSACPAPEQSYVCSDSALHIPTNLTSSCVVGHFL